MFDSFPLKRRCVSTEAIDFQNDKFGERIEAIVARIRFHITNDNSYASECDELVKLTKMRLNLEVKLITDKEDAAAFADMPSFFHTLLRGKLTSQFSQKDMSEASKEFIDAAKDKSFWVDTKTAKVSDGFKTLNATIYLNFESLIVKHKLTDKEIAAIALHELGHLFTYCELTDRVTYTNQVMANVVGEISKARRGDNYKKVNYIVNEFKTINENATEEDVIQLIDGNSAIVTAKIFYLYTEAITSQTNSVLQEKAAGETIADVFCARFGYGRHLLTGLDKLHRLDPEKNKTSRMAMRSIELLIVAIGIATSGFMLAILIVLGLSFVGGVTFMSTMLFLSWTYIFANYLKRLGLVSTAKSEFNYDELKQRYIRIRNETVAQLKDATQYSRDELKKMLSTIYEMDAVIEKTVNYRSIPAIIFDGLPGNKKALRELEQQRLIESLAHNDLFIRSAQFATV